MGNKGYIGTKGPPINREKDKISGDKGSTGNKGYIGAKGPSINTEQGTISGVKIPTGNKALLVTKGHSSVQSKVKCQVSKV